MSSTPAAPRRIVNRPLIYLALLVLILGWTGAGVAGWKAVKGGTGLILLESPGTRDFQIGRTGPHSIYHEYQGVLNHQYYMQEIPIKGLDLKVVEVATSRALALVPGDASLGYRFGARRSTQLATFDAPAPGDYQLVSNFPATARTSQTMLAIGDGREWRVRSQLYWIWGLTLGTTALAGLIALFGVVFRKD